MSEAASTRTRGIVSAIAVIGGFLSITGRWGFANTGSELASEKAIRECLFVLGLALAIIAIRGFSRPKTLRYLCIPAVLLLMLGTFLLVLPSISTGLVFERLPYGVTVVLAGVFGIVAWMMAMGARKLLPAAD